jgi:pyruvate, water dikinase
MQPAITNTSHLATSPLREAALTIAEAGYVALDTDAVLRQHIAFDGDALTLTGKVYNLRSYEHLYVIAIGKCALDAAYTFEALLGERITDGIALDIREQSGAPLTHIRYLRGTHPYPSAHNAAHTKDILSLARRATSRDIVVVLISGGGSTLLCQPQSHTPQQETTLVQHLFQAGATIHEINTIRKHCSLARGGHLATALHPAESIALIFSDVPNNDLHTIASGPTVLDSTTLDDARGVCRKYRCERSGFPVDALFETPKDQQQFRNMRNELILTNETALKSMAEKARTLGYRVLIRDTQLVGEAREVAQIIAEELHTAAPGTALLYGGETTVTVTGKLPASSRGGRNQELALAALSHLRDGELILSLASDGYDNSPHAGGIADTITATAAAHMGEVFAADALAAHNSYNFFHILQQGVTTGYTGSNVADIIIALHGAPISTTNTPATSMPKTHNPEYIIWYKDLTIDDVPKVGGKNAALGEMVRELLPLGVRVPNGFALTATAYHYFLDATGLRDRINSTLEGLDTHDTRELMKRGEQVRNMILAEELPEDLKTAIAAAYIELVEMEGAEDVAVRSSATAEDLPGASFAGQQETYLNVVGTEAVIASAKKCIASLFTNRAISYRFDKGFSHTDAALSVGVQKMVRSDMATSGVMFSIDTETGFDKVVVIEGAYGLGEMVVQGKVTPDSFIVFKPSLEKGLLGVIARDIGPKEVKMIYGEQGGVIVDVPQEDRDRYCLSDEEVSTLAKYALTIEKHFSTKHGHYQPMDMEWAKDGKTGELYIVQARPETVISMRDKNVFLEYSLTGDAPVLTTGTAVGTKIAHGGVHVIRDVEHIHDFKKGEVLVTEITDPDWEPIMKIASAIVTNKGGRTSHAAIVSRELGIPCIVGCGNATDVLHDDTMVTVDCSSGKEGRVLEGEVPFATTEHRLDKLPKLKTKVMVNIGSPEEAFKNTYLPVEGVGLGRLEFIIMSHIRIHPNALIEYDTLKWYAGEGQQDKQEVVQQIDELTKGYTDKTRYYVEELAEGIAKIAAAFYPHKVIIRFSDFKTNEYRTLIGGHLYEPEEENPMIGWRGASRYYDESFKKAFGFECEALVKVRDELGLDNVIPMVPFCRTLEEADSVLAVMAEYGLAREKGVPVYMMCEIPANVLLAEEFLERFDGFSIGSNDLTQLVLGMDRDNSHIAHVGNENNEAVKRMIRPAIEACNKQGKYIGICGQAPSDFPEFAQFLVKLGIQSLSFTPDTVIKTLPKIAEAEKEVGN